MTIWMEEDTFKGMVMRVRAARTVGKFASAGPNAPKRAARGVGEAEI